MHLGFSYGNPNASIWALVIREKKPEILRWLAVGDRIREVYDLLKAQGENTILEWNPGNHFKDAGIRTAKAFAWMIKEWTEN